MREPLLATIATLAGALILTVIVVVAYRKNKTRYARILISVSTVFIFLPLIFFTSGGVNGGAPIWILLGSYYLVVILDGRFRLVMSVINIIIELACFIIAFNCPYLVNEYDRGGDYFDSFVTYILVGLVLTFIVTFQTRV